MTPRIENETETYLGSFTYLFSEQGTWANTSRLNYSAMEPRTGLVDVQKEEIRRYENGTNETVLVNAQEERVIGYHAHEMVPMNRTVPVTY